MKDRFCITILGKSAHGSAPHRGCDAILAAAAVVQAFQTFASRRNNPNETFALTIGKMEGGTKENIIADQVWLEGMTRTENQEFRKDLPEQMEAMVQGVAAGYGCKAIFRFIPL